MNKQLIATIILTFALTWSGQTQEDNPPEPAPSATNVVKAEESDFIEIIQTPLPVESEDAETDSDPMITPVPADSPDAGMESPKLEVVTPEPMEEEITSPATPQPKPKKPTGPTRLKFPAVDNVLLDPPLPAHKSGTTPQTAGDTTGDVYIAHRAVVEKYNGWGWIKRESENWNQAKWSAVRETPGEIIAPGRYLKHPDNDADMQYRFYGEFSDETAYEPNKDTFVPIFNLKGFEIIGSASKPSGASMPANASAPTRSKPTTGGARSNPFGR